MTRLTIESAFSDIFQRYITPNIENIIINTGIIIINADHKSNPSNRNITRNVAAMLRLRFTMASPAACRYWS